MAFQFLCPQGHLLQGDEAHAGLQCQCPHCGIAFIIPALMAPVAPVQPQPQTYPQPYRMMPPPGSPSAGPAGAYPFNPYPSNPNSAAAYPASAAPSAPIPSPYPVSTFPVATYPANVFPANQYPGGTFSAVNSVPVNAYPAAPVPVHTEPAGADEENAGVGNDDALASLIEELRSPSPSSGPDFLNDEGFIPAPQPQAAAFPDFMDVAADSAASGQAPGVADLDSGEAVHITCPNGHELEVPLAMLNVEALCPQCRAKFLLRFEDSREGRWQQEFRERTRNKTVIAGAITAAVVVLLSLLAASLL